MNLLAQVIERFHFICHAYCLMDNHYHLVIETPEGNLSEGMRQLNGIYTQRYNFLHSKTGHVFQGRYKAIIVDRDNYLPGLHAEGHSGPPSYPLHDGEQGPEEGWRQKVIFQDPQVPSAGKEGCMEDQNVAPRGEIVLYQTEDGRTRIECRFTEETLWLSQALIAELFQKDVRTINEHLQNIYDDHELAPEATIRKFRIVRREGKREVSRFIEHYNLDAIIAIGYRVRSPRGTQFRRWATDRLREYLVKGFTMDDERLKNPPIPGSAVPDYFDELLERIRDIRASERRMYLRVREIFALAADYRTNDRDTTKFFQIIQNKLHFAATGRTAAELIAARADHTKPNMGLTTWKGGSVHKTDVTVAKNYLTEDEITELNRIVVMWLDYAEDQSRRRKQVFLRDWETKLNEFLAFNERRVLPDAGTVSKEAAETKAEEEYSRFAALRRTFLEAEAERDATRALEAAAKSRPLRKGKRRP